MRGRGSAMSDENHPTRLLAAPPRVVNVGLEGMMLVGAFAATLATLTSGTAFTGVAVAAVAGAILALLFALFAVKLTANQVKT